MSRRNCILNLPGFSIKKTYGHNPLIIEVNYRRKARCRYCGTTQLRKKDSFMRKVRHESIGLRQTLLRFKAYKFYCKAYARYFNQSFPGICKHQRSTERLQEQVFKQHTEGISQKSLSQQFKLGKSTVERWYHAGYLKKNSHTQLRHCPKILGIDEHHFSRKEGYATTLCDLHQHKIFDVVKGKSKKDLASYLDSLPGKENVKVICMDLSSSYRALVREYFPKALIVADRFHVIRLINPSFVCRPIKAWMETFVTKGGYWGCSEPILRTCPSINRRSWLYILKPNRLLLQFTSLNKSSIVY